jgi:hypothetical protein
LQGDREEEGATDVALLGALRREDGLPIADKGGGGGVGIVGVGEKGRSVLSDGGEHAGSTHCVEGIAEVNQQQALRYRG